MSNTLNPIPFHQPSDPIIKETQSPAKIDTKTGKIITIAGEALNNSNNSHDSKLANEITSIESSSSQQTSLEEKAVKDVKVANKGLIHEDFKISEENKEHLNNLKAKWKEPNLIFAKQEAALQACVNNDKYNGEVFIITKGGSYVLSIEPENPQQLQVTFFSKQNSKDADYITLTIPIIDKDKLTWNNKTFTDTHQLIREIADNQKQPLLNAQALPSKKILDFIFQPQQKITEKEVNALTYALDFLIKNKQFGSAQKLLEGYLAPGSTNELKILLNKAVALKNVSLVEFVLKHTPLDDLKTVDKNLLCVKLIQKGTLEEFDHIKRSLNISLSLQDVVKISLAERNIDLANIYSLVKQNDPSLLNKYQDAFLKKAFSGREVSEKLLKDNPEFVPIGIDTIRQILSEGRDNNTLMRVLSKYSIDIVDIIELLNDEEQNYVKYITFFVDQIKDEDTAKNIATTVLSERPVELLKLITKFPGMLNTEVALNILLTTINNSDDNSETNYYTPVQNKIIKLISTETLNELIKKPELFPLIIKLHYIPNGKVNDIDEILKTDPSQVVLLFRVLAKTPYLDYGNEKWTDILKTYWSIFDLPYNKIERNLIMEYAIKNNNISFIKFLFDNEVKLYPDEKLKVASLAFLHNVTEFSQFLPKLDLPHTDLGNLLIDYNNLYFVPNQENVFSKEQNFELINMALNNNQLSLAFILGGNLQEISQKIITLPTEELKIKLIGFFLNSKLADVEQLIKILEEKKLSPEQKTVIEYVTKYIHTGGRHIARFPKKSDQELMFSTYGKDYRNYIEQQENYGMKRAALYDKVLEQAKNNKIPFMTIISELAGFSDEHNRQVDLSLWRNYSRVSVEAETPVAGRYMSFLPRIAQHDYEVNGDKRDLLNGPNYTISYTLPDGKPLQLTSVRSTNIHEKRTKFIHTNPNNIQPALQEMSRLFDEIKNYPLQDGDTLPPDLKEKIAKIYWLGIHAMPTMRNFSQAALDLHALVHDVIGFESFPPSMEFILNDCVALSLPFDKFFELYERAFEKPPQKKT